MLVVVELVRTYHRLDGDSTLQIGQVGREDAFVVALLYRVSQ
jgi:hypothetical protein